MFGWDFPAQNITVFCLALGSALRKIAVLPKVFSQKVFVQLVFAKFFKTNFIYRKANKCLEILLL